VVRRKRPPSIADELLAVIRDDAEQVFNSKATREASYPGLLWRSRFSRKVPRNRTVGVRSQRLTESETLGFAMWYMEALGDAAGHMAYLIAQALAFRQGLGLEEVRYVQARVDEFIKEHLDPSVVEEWLTDAVTKAPGNLKMEVRVHGKMLSQISKQVSSLPAVLSTYLSNHKLMVALALFGGEEVKLEKIIPRPVLPPEEWKKRKSLSQPEAASALVVSARQVRNLVKEKKLTRTSRGRIAVDENFEREYAARHSPIRT
jgi:hypothetical protein